MHKIMVVTIAVIGIFSGMPREMLEVGLRMSAFKARRDALAVLTPDQRETAKVSHEKRMQEMRNSPQSPTPRGSH